MVRENKGDPSRFDKGGPSLFFFFFLKILPTKIFFFLGPREAQAGLGPYLDSSLVTRLNL